jgi:hypothetical protein
VRIANFAHSTSLRLSDARYFAPECFDGTFRCASDVFAFGVILFELLARRPAFPEGLHPYQLAFRVIEGDRPEIPDSVAPPARALIADCWAQDPDERPMFEEIADRLAEMEFRVAAKVKSAKVAEFVRSIEKWEDENIRE